MDLFHGALIQNGRPKVRFSIALRKNKYEFNRLFTVVLIRRQFAFVL